MAHSILARVSVGLLPVAGLGMAMVLSHHLPGLLRLGWRALLRARPARATCARRAAIPLRGVAPPFLAALLVLAVLAAGPMPTPGLAGMGVFLSGLAVLAVLDGEFGIVPDFIVLPLSVGGVIAARSGCSPASWPSAVAGLIVGWGIGKAVQWGLGRRTGRDSAAEFGSGDVKLLAAVGAWLGGLSPYAVCLTAFAGFCLGRRCRLVRQNATGPVAFGPYLFIATAGIAPLWTSLDF